MKTLILLTTLAIASCNRYGSGGSPTGPHAPPYQLRCPFQGPVDFIKDGSQYHYSWCHNYYENYTHAEAVNYCSSLGRGWQGVSIESRPEDNFISGVVETHNLAYIWTSGTKESGRWRWASGEPFLNLNWSNTGGNGVRQPDNRENNNENCLAVLNHFYNDGIRWHDIACHHVKPIICERKGSGPGYHR
ncbi:snaclec coagulation factor IX/factor X-binding protein subunit A-like [Penaeus vannamei]|uniref:snaclec coagulation factor IX/factor X-binding protein subunit A-like n=1 Tax=Penaeus vannamei TaxID=6689 RepID=UPI00387F9B56